MLVWDEYTQEWVEDGSEDTTPALTGLQTVIEQSPDFEEDQTPVPPPPPGYRSDIVRGGIPVGPIEGTLPDKYRARQMAQEEIAARANRYDSPQDVPARHTFVTGYGDRLISKEAPYSKEAFDEHYRDTPGDWKLAGGGAAPQEYVDDVLNTMDARDSGEMSETQLREKIKAREGQPPGRKPTEGEINIVDFVNFHMSDVDPKLREQAKAARKQWEGSVSYSTRALNEAAFDAKGAALEEKMYNELRNEEKALATKHAERLQRLEDAKRTPKTTTDSIRSALRSELGREPTEREVLTETARFSAESAGAKEKSKVEAKGTFRDWTPEAKEQEFTLHMISGKPPVSAAGLGGGDRQQYGKEYAQWKADKGIRPQDVALMQADYKSGDMSLRNMAKQEAPMEAFVGNINKQIEKIKQLYDNNDRTGLRLIDLPVRELKMRAVGSGDEAVKASYLLEISNEIGKLSSGASASVQQLSDSAKEDWKRVHDPNLSLAEIMKVVNATRDQANMRLETWKAAKEAVRGHIRAIGDLEGGARPATGPQIPSKPKFIIKRVN